METDDQLLDQLLQSRTLAMERVRASQQTFILVASLLDRIPNLAGLARTCEVCNGAHNTSYNCWFFPPTPTTPPPRPFFFSVLTCSGSIILQSYLFYANCFSLQVFKASGLTIADSNILSDKQFQLIRF